MKTRSVSSRKGPGWLSAGALSLTLCACTQGSLSPLTAPAHQARTARPALQAQSRADEARVQVLGEAGIEQVQLSLRLNGDGRGLRTQATSSNQLAFVRIEVRGQGLSSPRFANNGELIPVSGGSVSATIAGIPRSSGALRLITLRGYDADERELGAFELRGWYRSGASTVSPALSRRDLLLGRVLEELLTDRPEDLTNLDVEALQLILDEVTGYDATSRRLFVTDPNRFLPFGVTDLIPAGGSPLPDAAAITSNSLQALETVEVDLTTPRGRAFGEGVTVTIDDPGSKPARLASGSADGSTVSIPGVAPGNWTLRAYASDGELLGETAVEVVDGVAIVDQDPLALPDVRELIVPLRVNSTTAAAQRRPVSAISADGLAVVAWFSDGQDGDGTGIYAQRYDSRGVAIGPEFLVNEHTTGGQIDPAIAMDADGNFLIAWHGTGSGDASGIFARRFASSGTPLGPHFMVNQDTVSVQANVNVALDDDGDAAFVWHSYGQDGDGPGIVARLYSRTDSFGNEMLVNEYTTGFQRFACVDMDADGDFVIGWQGANGQDGDSTGIYARLYASNGTPSGNEFNVNDDYTTSNQARPHVGLDSDGDFVMSWDSIGPDGSVYGIVARRFDRNGTPLDTSFVANEVTAGSQMYNSLAMDPDGDFVLSWEFYGYDFETLSYYGHVYARRFQANGSPEGNQFQLNLADGRIHQRSAVAISANGFVIPWETSDYGASNNDIYLMRYDADGDAF